MFASSGRAVVTLCDRDFRLAHLDRIAAKVDAQFFPNDPKAPDTPLATGVRAALRLVGLCLLINILLLPMDIGIPGLAEIVTILTNGWLLGREFFVLAALRHLSRRYCRFLMSLRLFLVRQ